jgi:hypothetical protein
LASLFPEMKNKTILSLIFICVSLSGSCQLNEGINHSKINVLTGNEKFDVNALIWLPPGYDSAKKYPLVIYGHGSAQAGQDLNQLYLDGLPAILKRGYKPPFDCVIICPQRASYSVLPEWLPGIIQDAEKRFGIDTTRIYLTGTSAGGYMCYGSQLNVSMSLSKKIAAICVISGATQDAKKENLEWWVRSKTNCWAIVGSEDQAYVRQNIFLINAVNQRSPGLAKISIRPGVGHGQWEDIYDGSFSENNINIWQWLYQHKLLPPVKPTGKKSGKKITLNARNNQIYCTDVKREYNAQPGDTLVLPTGITSFLLANFKGEKGLPITLIPLDSGWIGGYINYSAHISHAEYFKISGFHIDGNNQTHFGIIIAGQTSNYEISNCYIKNIGSIGLCAKQDPDSTQVTGSWPGFSIKNVSIHDITVRNTGTEGFYLGYTFDIVKPLASPIENLLVYNIRIDSTGWDGLQLSNCHNVRMHNIVISNYGLKNQRGQQGGLFLGGMVTLKDSILNVTISDGTGAGLLVFGRGSMTFSRFVLKNVGMSKGENAIFVNDYIDLGFGLPPLQINFNNIKINGSSGKAMIVFNGNKTMLPGTIRNFMYMNTQGGIQDNIDQIIKN